MTEYNFSDEQHNEVIKEAEEIKLKRMEEEAQKARERDETIRTFENLSHRIESGKEWFDIPPLSPGEENNSITMTIGDAKKIEMVEITLLKRKRKRKDL